jgi:hypothetical protein
VGLAHRLGPVTPKDGGHGELGNAVLLPRDRVVDWKEAHNHYLAVSRATPGQPVVHYVGAGWDGERRLPDAAGVVGLPRRLRAARRGARQVTLGATSAAASGTR